MREHFIHKVLIVPWTEPSSLKRSSVCFGSKAVYFSSSAKCYFVFVAADLLFQKWLCLFLHWICIIIEEGYKMLGFLFCFCFCTVVWISIFELWRRFSLFISSVSVYDVSFKTGNVFSEWSDLHLSKHCPHCINIWIPFVFYSHQQPLLEENA